MQSRRNVLLDTTKRRKTWRDPSMSTLIIRSLSSLLSINKLSKMAFSIQPKSHRVFSSSPTEDPSGMPRKSRCLAASLAIPRDPPFYSRSDLLGGRVFPRKNSSFLSQDVFPRPRGEKTVAKKTRLCDPRLRKTSREKGGNRRGRRRGFIEMTVEKRRRTVTPDIGIDTKSLIWLAGFFPQVDETPFPQAGIPPLCASSWGAQ